MSADVALPRMQHGVAEHCPQFYVSHGTGGNWARVGQLLPLCRDHPSNVILPFCSSLWSRDYLLHSLFHFISFFLSVSLLFFYTLKFRSLLEV